MGDRSHRRLLVLKGVAMTNDQRIILVASLAEAATGLGLLAVPSIIIGLLLDETSGGLQSC